MAHKLWQKWVKIACVPILLLVTTTADFTTECQRPCDCRWQSGNKAAICSNSSLKFIPANLSSDIQTLDLTNNNLQQLHHEVFKKARLSNLKKLFLKECNIEIVHKTAFATLAIMIELDLSKNKIRHLHQDTFKGTEKLRLINLSYNLIDKLEDGLFRNLKFLQKVEMSNNKIVRIGSKTFVNLPQLKILRLDGNNLSHMKPDTFTQLKNLSGLDLHNNPWKCDCNLQSFRDWVMTHNLYTPPTSCAEPPSIRNKLWNELNTSNFACRPTILEPQPDSTIRSHDENVTLVCKVVGNPTPEVFWKFNGKLIEMKTFGEIRYVVNENTMDLLKWVNLTIVFARYSDKGNYSCVAENPGGQDEKSLTLHLSKYGTGTIAGMDGDVFAILVGCILTLMLICGGVLTICYFTSQNNDTKRLIKTDTRSSNGEALIDGSINAEIEKGKTEVNPITKPPRKYEAPSSLTSQATEMSELNKTLLDSESILASNEDNVSHQGLEMSKISQELLERLVQDTQYPPDLLSFPLRNGAQVSPATSGHDRPKSGQNGESPKSPGNGVSFVNNSIYNRLQAATTSQSSLISPKLGYVTLPRRPKVNWIPESSVQPPVYSTPNGDISYHENFNMKLFGPASNYSSLNKSDVDLSPFNKLSYQDISDDLEPAPSPAPGTPHANIPKNSLSSPNIYNQLLALQAMSINAHGRFTKVPERSLKVTLTESDGLKHSLRDLRVGYSVHVNSTLGTSRTIQKPRKRHSSDFKEPFLLNNCETATQV